MQFVFDGRASDAPLVETIWRTRSVGGGSFLSSAGSHLELVITRQRDQTMVTVRGPETKARPAPVPEDAEFLGIVFRLGTYLPPLPAPTLIDGGVNLPLAAGRSFWLHGSAWPFPTYENADTFVTRLVRAGLLAHDSVVAAALSEQLPAVSSRTIRRRCLHVTGLTPKTIQQIERARQAAERLRRGVPILDVAYETGYFDQAHMTRSLKRLIGQTPAQILRSAVAS